MKTVYIECHSSTVHALVVTDYTAEVLYGLMVHAFKLFSLISYKNSKVHISELQRQTSADTTEPSNTEEADADRLDAPCGDDSGG